jgi:Tfp pilus assembly protein PilO
LGSAAARRLRSLAALCLALIVLNLLVYVLAVEPAAARFAGQQGRYQELKRQQADALLFRKQKETLKGLQAGIPAQKDVPILIKELVQRAHRLNLSVGAVNSDIPQPGNGGLTMLTFSVPLSGAYGNLKRFIYEVETADRVIGIQDLKLDAEKGSVKLQMKLLTYIRGE